MPTTKTKTNENNESMKNETVVDPDLRPRDG